MALMKEGWQHCLAVQVERAEDEVKPGVVSVVGNQLAAEVDRPLWAEHVGTFERGG